jgi:lauroyl/myristoyl acyltransferase
VVLLLAIAGQLPLWLTRPIGTTMGLLMMAANRKRRDVVRINLVLCFPDKTPAARARLARRHFIVAGQAFVDLGLLVFGPRWRVLRAVRLIGLEHLRAQLERGGRTILLVPHMVGMNFAGAVVVREHRGFTMMKLQRNPIVNWMLNRGRARFGGELISRHQGLRPVLRRLRRGQGFYYLPDEDFGPKQSVFAPFFGVPRATLPSLGRLAELADAAVLPFFVRLLPWGRGYEATVHPPLTGFPRGDAVADATAMNRALEAGIAAMPEQYMWTLKFFRTRPDGAPSPYPATPRRSRRG